ncbi:1-acyl-sn-glycerol-3-phosphate acyltransferase, partial [Streptomyces albidoflavus]
MVVEDVFRHASRGVRGVQLLKYALLGPLLRLMFRPRVEGLEHVPEEGAAIVAGNHLSFADHFLMP